MVVAAVDAVAVVAACTMRVDEWSWNMVCAQWYQSLLLVGCNIVADVVVELVSVEDDVDVVCFVVAVDVSTVVVVV